MPKFSIIIPVYNVENYLEQCINSILNQTFTDFEALCVDDCGTDNSSKILKKYAKIDQRIKILKHKRNLGLAAARNTALANAKGDYIFCLDSDDWATPNALEKVFKEFQLRKTSSIWFNAKKYIENTHSFDIEPMYNYNEGYLTLIPDNIAFYTDFTWIKAYTRESIQKYNLCWPQGLTFEDGEFYFKYFTHNPRTYIIEDCLINYRIRKGSIVREANNGNVKMNDIYQIIRNLKQFYVENNLYEKYKITLLKLIQNRIRMCKGLNYSDENKKLSYEFLREMAFPEEFEEFKVVK